MARMAREVRPEQHCEDRNLGRTAAMATASSVEHQAKNGKMSLSITQVTIAASRVTSSLPTTTQAATRIPTMATGDLEAL